MEELKHYGVIGMKWGVRRGRVDKAYSKASKKLNKLDKKFNKKEEKAIAKSNKADKKQYATFVRDKSRQKAADKAKKASAELARQANKANKWYKTMEKTFANTNISMSPEQVAMGKKYANAIRSRAINRYY